MQTRLWAQMTTTTDVTTPLDDSCQTAIAKSRADVDVLFFRQTCWL